MIMLIVKLDVQASAMDGVGGWYGGVMVAVVKSSQHDHLKMMTLTVVAMAWPSFFLGGGDKEQWRNNMA